VRTGRPDLALGIGLDCGVVDDIVLKAEARPADAAHALS